MVSLSNDLSIITAIPKLTLEKLFSKESLCVAHAVFESIKRCESDTCIDIGIGKLYIRLVDDSIKYKFSPSSELDSYIRDVSLNSSDPLICSVEEALKNKIEKTYKELF